MRYFNGGMDRVVHYGGTGDTLHQSKNDQITLIKSQSVHSSKSPYQTLFSSNKSIARHRQFG